MWAMRPVTDRIHDNRLLSRLLGVCYWRLFAMVLMFAGCQQNSSESVGDGGEIDDEPVTVSVVHRKSDAERPIVDNAHTVNGIDANQPSLLASDDPARELNPVESVSQVSTSTSRPVLSDADRTFQKLVAARRESNPENWEQAEKSLEALGKGAVSVLVNALKSSDVEVRELAAMWLVRLGPDAQDAEKQLAEVLDDESAFVRVNAASALSHIPEHAERVVPILAELLTHGEFSVRITAATALGNAGANAVQAVPVLIDSLDAKEEDLQIAVLSTLGRIGSGARDALKPISELFRTTSSEVVKKSAEEAFRLIQAESK